MNKHCQLAYLEVRRIGSIQRYLSFEIITNLVSSLVFSRLDCCKTLLAGSPQFSLTKFKVVNRSARLIFKAPESSYTISLRSPLATSQQPDSIQNRSHRFPRCLWYSSSIPLSVASSLLSFSLSSLSLGYSQLQCS